MCASTPRMYLLSGYFRVSYPIWKYLFQIWSCSLKDSWEFYQWIFIDHKIFKETFLSLLCLIILVNTFFFEKIHVWTKEIWKYVFFSTISFPQSFFLKLILEHKSLFTTIFQVQAFDHNQLFQQAGLFTAKGSLGWCRLQNFIESSLNLVETFLKSLPLKVAFFINQKTTFHSHLGKLS